MAIRMRRGNLADFDPTKQLSGEFGVSIDNSAGNQKVFMAFGNGNVKELMTVEDAEAQIGELVDDAVDAAIGDIVDTVTEAAETATTAAQTATTQAGTATTKAGEAASSASSASADATSAAGSAASADDSAEDSEAWAVGQRDGQDVPTTDETYHNNAKYWAEQASQAAGGGVTSFNGRSGSVSPQSGDYTAAMVGLGNVDNTSDLNKPISTATQTALNGKADTSSLTDGSVTKIGTGNVGSATQPVYINGGVPTAIQPEDAAGSFGFLTRVTNAVNIDTTDGNWTMAITPSSAQGTMPWTDYWAQITQFRSGAFCTQIATLIRYSSSDRPDRLAIRHKYVEAGSSYVWSSWKMVYGITTGTPTNIHANLTLSSGYSFVQKSGNVVRFRVLAKATAGTLGTYTILCKLPFVPIAQEWGTLDYGVLGSAFNHANWYMDTSGNVCLAHGITLSANQDVNIIGTYMTNA